MGIDYGTVGHGRQNGETRPVWWDQVTANINSSWFAKTRVWIVGIVAYITTTERIVIILVCPGKVDKVMWISGGDLPAH